MFSASVETDTINSAEPQTSLSPVEVVPPSVATHKNLSTERSASNETPEFYSVGENINVANFSYRVNSIKFVKTVGNEYTRETADGIYLIVSLTFRNNDREEHTLDNSFFKLTDQTGIQFETSTEGETALEMSGQETLFLKQCNPQITKSGFLIFEVPDKRSYTLHLSGGFWSGKTGVVRITPK